LQNRPARGSRRAGEVSIGIRCAQRAHLLRVTSK
jgi:hypothetical protein